MLLRWRLQKQAIVILNNSTVLPSKDNTGSCTWNLDRNGLSNVVKTSKNQLSLVLTAVACGAGFQGSGSFSLVWLHSSRFPFCPFGWPAEGHPGFRVTGEFCNGIGVMAPTARSHSTCSCWEPEEVQWHLKGRRASAHTSPSTLVSRQSAKPQL